MQFKSFVRQTLKLKRHKIVNILETDNNLHIWLDVHTRKSLPCHVCQGPGRRYDHLPERQWHHVPLWGKPVVLHYAPWRIQCKACGGVKVEHLEWADSYKSPMTQALVAVLAAFAKLLSIRTVAALFDVSWGTVAKAVKKAVEYGLEHRDLDEVHIIGVDEVARRRGHIYQTVVYDLTNGRLLWTGPKRARETLENFFRMFGEDRSSQLTYILMDMWKPFRDAAEEYAPQAVIIYDKFHMMKHLHDAVDAVRRMESKGNKKLKKCRWALLKKPSKLTQKQKAKLDEILAGGLKVGRAWSYKESFQQIWACQNSQEASAFFQRWFWRATHSRIKPIRKAAWTIKRHCDGFFAYFDHRETSARVEAWNNSIKVLSRRARGFRTSALFESIALLVLGKLPGLPCSHLYLPEPFMALSLDASPS